MLPFLKYVYRNFILSFSQNNKFLYPCLKSAYNMLCKNACLMKSAIAERINDLIENVLLKAIYAVNQPCDFKHFLPEFTRTFSENAWMLY